MHIPISLDWCSVRQDMHLFQSLFHDHNIVRQHLTNISQDSVLWKAFLNTSCRKTLHLPCSDIRRRSDDNSVPAYVFIWSWRQSRDFTGGYVSDTAQGLNTTLTHPCSVNTEAMHWCMCVWSPGLQGFIPCFEWPGSCSLTQRADEA